MANWIAQGVAAILVLSSVVESDHFRGGTIQWRPLDPQNFDGMIEFRHRFAWTRTAAPEFNCTEADIGTTRLFGDRDTIDCRSGCSVTVSYTDVHCTDYLEPFNTGTWIVGERTSTYNMEDVTNFEASYNGTNRHWIALAVGGDSWEIRVRGSLSPRSDNGRINSSPTTTFTPLRLQGGCTHNISIPVQDLDQDTVRCRWAEGSEECAGVCNSLPEAVLNQDTCTVTWSAPNSASVYAVAVQIEDFITPLSSVPLSSVPLQFTLDAFISPTTCTGGIRPTLVPGETPSDGACITVPVNSTYRASIVAASGHPSISIAQFITASPFGLVASPVIQSQYISTHYYSNITWTPIASQLEGLNLFCFQAQSSSGLLTEQWCVTLLERVPAALLIHSVSPSGVLPLASTSIWEITFNHTITRPRASRYVRFYEATSGRNVYSIDVMMSSAATYQPHGNTLMLNISASFTAGLEYYILVDDGVAVHGACGHSEAITDGNFWTFSKAPPSVQMTIAEPTLTELETTTVECTVIRGAGNSDLTLWRNGELLVQVTGDYLIYTTTPGAFGNYTCVVDGGSSHSALLYERVEFQLLLNDISTKQCNFTKNQHNIHDLNEAILAIFIALCPQCDSLNSNSIVDTHLSCGDSGDTALTTAGLVYISPDGQTTASMLLSDFQELLSSEDSPALVIYGTRYTLNQQCPVQRDATCEIGTEGSETTADTGAIAGEEPTPGLSTTLIIVFSTIGGSIVVIVVVCAIIAILCVRKIGSDSSELGRPLPAMRSIAGSQQMWVEDSTA